VEVGDHREAEEDLAVDHRVVQEDHQEEVVADRPEVVSVLVRDKPQEGGLN